MNVTIWLLFKNSFTQFLAFFGVILAGAAVLTFLSRWTNNVFRQFRFPSFGTYAFGLIGVPVHEFCHALFCKLFFHEIKSVKWFDPQAKGGAHGSVTHLYRPWNLYHRLGHFFIGLGPVLLAPLLIMLLLYALVPTARPALHLAANGAIWPVTQSLFLALLSKSSLTSPGLYIFIYLATCITSQMELSREDLKQASFGILPILLVFFIVNSISLYFNLNWHSPLYSIGLILSGLALSIFTLAATLSALNLILCALILNFINRVSGAESINPFKS